MEQAKRAAELMAQLRVADNDAAREVFARYAARLGRLAERHLTERLRGRLDGDDIVQSVLRTFFRRSARGDFQVDHSAQLWQLLVRITLLRVRAKARHHTAAMRNVRLEEQPQDELPADFLAREPSPADAALLVDTVDRMVAGLPPLHLRVAEMRLAGYAAPEIADELHVSRRTIYRVLELLQQRLCKQTAEPGGDPRS